MQGHQQGVPVCHHASHVYRWGPGQARARGAEGGSRSGAGLGGGGAVGLGVGGLDWGFDVARPALPPIGSFLPVPSHPPTPSHHRGPWGLPGPPTSCPPSLAPPGDTEAAFNRVRDQVRIPMYGCDCYAYGLLASGLADIVVEADLKPYDYMALVPIIQAGQGDPGQRSVGPGTWRGRGGVGP